VRFLPFGVSLFVLAACRPDETLAARECARLAKGGVVTDCRKQDGPYELMEPTHSLDAFTATRFTVAGTEREGGVLAFRDAVALDFAVAHLPNLPYAVDRPRLLLIYFTMGTPADVQEKPKTLFQAGK
jgi:hypothetical protein